MLYFKFKNYEEFKEVFGTRVANNGKKVRSNNILLSFLKHEFKCKRFDNLECMSINRMERHILSCTNDYLDTQYLVNNVRIYSKDYEIDEWEGRCEDGDPKCVRYVRKDNGKVYKMKAGKFMRHVLESCGATNLYCEQAIIYVCERFAEDWTVYIRSNFGDGLTLCVDDDFEGIYNESNYKGDFNSCMSDKEQYSFYEDAVMAKAACLKNDDGYIVARCVIFTKVHDAETDEVFRLAERQYSSNGDNSLKQILVNKLIETGWIDGYKQIGVDCHSPRSFVLNDGTSIADRKLWIRCCLDFDDMLSYQDSFKWYDMDSRKADNYGYGEFDLSTTERHLEGEWDSYHERYCRSVTDVYVWDDYRHTYILSTCDSDDLEDFEEFEYEYYNDCVYSDYDDRYYPRNRVVWSDFHNSELLEDCAQWCEEASDYFSYDNFDEDFEQWKKKNWCWDELNCEYVCETVLAFIWNDNEYVRTEVSRDYAESFLESYDGNWYSVLNEDGVPFDLVEELE